MSSGVCSRTRSARAERAGVRAAGLLHGGLDPKRPAAPRIKFWMGASLVAQPVEKLLSCPVALTRKAVLGYQVITYAFRLLIKAVLGPGGI